MADLLWDAVFKDLKILLNKIDDWTVVGVLNDCVE